MPIVDRQINWKDGRVYFPIKLFQGLDNNGTADISLSQGTPTVEPDATGEVVVLPMTTADEIAHITIIPWNLNRDKKVLGKIHFVHASTDADTPQFTFTIKFYSKQEGLAEFISGADASTAFAAHTCSTTTNSLESTVWTDISFDDYVTATDVYMAFSIELNALGSASADECKLLGFEMAYEIQACDNNRRQTSEMVLQEQPV